jgi:hypothetical protein
MEAMNGVPFLGPVVSSSRYVILGHEPWGGQQKVAPAAIGRSGNNDFAPNHAIGHQAALHEAPAPGTFQSNSTSSRRRDMKVIVRFSERQGLRGVPILLRHSPGMVLPNRTYVLQQKAVQALRTARICIIDISAEANAPNARGVASERR